MSLVQIVVPVNKHYVFATTQSREECANKLNELIANGSKKDGEEKPLLGVLSDSSFVVRQRSSWWRQLFQPIVTGKIEESANGSATVKVVTKLRRPAEFLINTSISTLAGAVVGLLASMYLVPDAVAITYAFLGMALIPMLTAIAVVLFAQSIVPEDSKFLLEKFTQVFGSAAAKPDQQTSAQEGSSGVWEQILAFALSCGLALLIAHHMHDMYWHEWKKGQYLKCEDICRPVAFLTEAFLGRKSGAAMDSRYRLAECLRCEGPEELRVPGQAMSHMREAKEIYESILDDWKRSKSENHAFVADVMFSLARVYDQLGQHWEAEEYYRKAIEIWQSSKKVGARDMFLSRAYDRLAMLLLKQSRFDEALAAAFQAMSIDLQYGDQAQRSLGEDYNDIALIYDKMEDWDNAANYYEKALAYKIKHVGAEHYSVATTLFNLSEVRKAQNNKPAYRELSGRAYLIWSNFIGAMRDENLPDAMQKYQVVMSKSRPDYEEPNSDTRFDGLRPYMGRP